MEATYMTTADYSFDLAPNPCAGRDPVAVQSEFTLSNVEGSGGKINQKNLFMQNKPNLCVFWAVSGDCEEKQTQTNPIQTQNKPNCRNAKNEHKLCSNKEI